MEGKKQRISQGLFLLFFSSTADDEFKCVLSFEFAKSSASCVIYVYRKRDSDRKEKTICAAFIISFYNARRIFKCYSIANRTRDYTHSHPLRSSTRRAT